MSTHGCTSIPCSIYGISRELALDADSARMLIGVKPPGLEFTALTLEEQAGQLRLSILNGFIGRINGGGL